MTAPAISKYLVYAVEGQTLAALAQASADADPLDPEHMDRVRVLLGEATTFTIEEYREQAHETCLR